MRFHILIHYECVIIQCVKWIIREKLKGHGAEVTATSVHEASPLEASKLLLVSCSTITTCPSGLVWFLRREERETENVYKFCKFIVLQ